MKCGRATFPINSEQLQYTVLAGETITFIRHRKATGTGAEAAYAYNYVMIGTKQGIIR